MANWGPEDIRSIAQTIQPQLRKDESLKDVLAYAEKLGRRRAELLGREADQDDLKFALSIFTWWPFKPKPRADVEDVLLQIRLDALTRGGPQALADLVPEHTLGMQLDSLFAAQQDRAESFLQMPYEAGY